MEPDLHSPGGLDGAPFLTEAVWVGRLLRFAVRAVGRRRRLAIAVLVSTIVAAVAFVQVVPRLYRVETRILTFESLLLPALISPRRPVPKGAEDPTRGAVELLKSRQSTIAIVDDANLRATWADTRGLVGNLKDEIREIISGPMTDEDFRTALVELLDERMTVYVDGEVLVVRVEWHHPDTAMAIAEAANRRFLDMKREADLAEVRETVVILEGRVKETQAEVDRAREALEKLAKTGRDASIPMKTIQVRRAPPPEDPLVAGRRDTLERELESVSRELGRVEAVYERRSEEARQTLAQLRESLGPNHPDIQEAVRVVEERARPSSELLQLRAREGELKGELAKVSSSTGRVAEETVETIRVPDRAAMGAAAEQSLNPELTTAEETLRDRIYRHVDALTRLETAQTELITARAAFNYRYIVTQPPLLPRRHVKPNAPVVIVGGIVAGFILALLAAVAADLLSRRVVEPWQIEVEASIPVLGIVRVSDASSVARGGER